MPNLEWVCKVSYFCALAASIEAHHIIILYKRIPLRKQRFLKYHIDETTVLTIVEKCLVKSVHIMFCFMAVSEHFYPWMHNMVVDLSTSID